MTVPIQAIEDHTLVFVAGLHRCGTTALARCLAGHADFSGLSATGVPEDEGQHLQDVYPTAKSLGGPGRFALNRAAHLTEKSPLATDASAARLWAAWAPHWASSRHFLVEKSPPNLLMTRFLTRLFPDAVHLVITRHPVIVTLSTAKWAEDTDLTVLFDNWFAAHETLRDDVPHLPRAKVVTYEALTRRPTETLAGIAEFIGLDVPPPHHTIEADRSAVYERMWESMARSSAPSVRATHARVTERYAERALAFGYRMDDTAFEGVSCLT